MGRNVPHGMDYDETEETPAPWTVHQGDDYIVLLGEHDTTDAPIASFCWFGDAQLASAAPDMLAALEALVAYVDDNPPTVALGLLNDAKVAIAKAKAGEAADHG